MADQTKMTPKQERFVAEYLVSLNAVQAAGAAGYSTPSVQGHRVLNHPLVAAAIGEKTKKVMGKLDISLERTLQEIGRIAFFDPARMYEPDGSVKLMSEIDDDTRACIASFEVVELFNGDGEQKHVYGLLKKVKRDDKNSALDKLMRYHSAYKDKVEHSGEVAIRTSFDKMTAAELDAYAQSGTLPPWFPRSNDMSASGTGEG